MSANNYGTANPVPSPFFLTALLATSCPVGVETNIWGAGLSAPSPGVFYPVAFVYQVYIMGGTPPSQVLLNIRVGGGADMQSLALPPYLLTAGNTFFASSMLVGTPSANVWAPPGANLYVSVTSQTQGITLGTGGVYAQFMLFRAPDQ